MYLSYIFFQVAELAAKQLNVDCEVIDLVSVLPWDTQTVCNVRSSGESQDI